MMHSKDTFVCYGSDGDFQGAFTNLDDAMEIHDTILITNNARNCGWVRCGYVEPFEEYTTVEYEIVALKHAYTLLKLLIQEERRKNGEY